MSIVTLDSEDVKSQRAWSLELMLIAIRDSLQGDRHLSAVIGDTSHSLGPVIMNASTVRI